LPASTCPRGAQVYIKEPKHYRVDRLRDADRVVLRQHVADQASRQARNIQGAGDQDRGFYCPQFLQLQEPNGLPISVEYSAAGGDFLTVEVAAMRQDGGDTGPQVAAGERHIPAPDTSYVGDGAMRSDWQP